MPILIIESKEKFKEYRRSIPNDTTIGFVPTMGALHEGHLSLIESSKNSCHITVCSIFVNPTQFNNPEDLKKYPRTIEEDLELLESVGCDLVFYPSSSDIYSEKTFLKFDFGELERTMEGEFRPGHFNGVATVVSKLFHIVKPNKAFFGQKDLQQVAVIQDLTKALDFDLEIVRCSTVRSEKGLALSSRNQRLSEVDKDRALILYRIQNQVIIDVKKGLPITECLDKGKSTFFENFGHHLEYLKLVDANTLQDYTIGLTTQELAVCIAAVVSDVRLIDNIVFEL